MRRAAPQINRKGGVPLDKKRMLYTTMGFGILLIVIMILLAWGGRRQSGGIILPESQTDNTGMDENGQNSRLHTVSVSPETASAAVSFLTMSRPSSYSRTQLVETFWSGGSGQSSFQIYVSGTRTRLDAALPDGSVRHTLVEKTEEQTLAGVWYDEEDEWTLLRSPDLTADLAGRMLSYEALREVPAEDIALADYREEDGAGCIYVETHPDEAGYRDRYWVSVESGLLTTAERLYGETVVYRFTAGEADVSPQEESLFVLPDGSTLAEAA